MYKAMPIARINFVSLFIVEERSDVFQGFCNCAPDFGGTGTLLGTAITTTFTTTTTFILHRDAVACFYFSKAFPRQYVAYIDGSSCKNK